MIAIPKIFSTFIFLLEIKYTIPCSVPNENNNASISTFAAYTAKTPLPSGPRRRVKKIPETMLIISEGICVKIVCKIFFDKLCKFK